MLQDDKQEPCANWDISGYLAFLACCLICAICLVKTLWHLVCGELPMFAWSLGFVGLSMIAGCIIGAINDSRKS